jgi:circadian clock protein KaiB
MTKFVFKLYITGFTSRSERAIHNLNRICEEAFDGACELLVIDVLERPQLAENDRIMATPTLIKEQPGPARRVIGDLSNRKQVLAGLGITPELL